MIYDFSGTQFVISFLRMIEAPTLTSVGSLIIDDIYYEDGRKVYNILGGAGIFAIYGKKNCIP